MDFRLVRFPLESRAIAVYFRNISYEKSEKFYPFCSFFFHQMDLFSVLLGSKEVGTKNGRIKYTPLEEFF